MSIQHYTVTGMTCGNCVHHVTEEVRSIPGVDDVQVVLDGGRMTITANEPIPFADVQDAVAEAGNYSVAEAADQGAHA